MDIQVPHLKNLKGQVWVSGNKNAALSVIAASLLCKNKVTLYNIPNITDVGIFLDFLRSIGVGVTYNAEEEILHLDYTTLKKKKTLVIKDVGRLSKIRAVILLLAGLIARFEKVKFMGGFTGCSLGSRPLTVHFENLEKLGVEVVYKPEYIQLSSKKLASQKDSKLIWQRERSVTATEVALIVSTVRRGKTTIYNAASEPHVQDTVLFLRKLGVKINGLGTDSLTVDPTQAEPAESSQVEFAIKSDHHEITTWLALSVLTKGKVEVIHNLNPQLLFPMVDAFNLFGIEVQTQRIARKAPSIKPQENEHLYVSMVKNYSIRPKTKYISGAFLTIKPAPWPGLPVDLLPLYIPLAAYTKDPVLFHNWMYDGALFWVLELRKAGFKVLMADPHRALVQYSKPVSRPVTFEAPYIIRATLALFILGASLPAGANILNADTINRAHPFFREKLQGLGADFKIL